MSTLTEADDSRAVQRGGKRVILVVDDQPGNVFVLYEMLKADYEVCVANSGEDALAFCADRSPDLVLLDIMMPGMDGHEVCRRLKSDDAMRDIPVIFVTARNTPAEEGRALDEGGADFISKPFHETVVKARVRTQMLLRAQSEALRSYAAIDGLTGLANRRRFDEALDGEWRRAERDGSPLSLLLLDVDRFKAYNDAYGHQAGDFCLRVLASSIKPFARRPGDIVARYGGEELAILLAGADELLARRNADAVHAAIRGLALPHAGNADCGGLVTVSIGVATYRPGVEPVAAEVLVARADKMLYEAKRLGRNRSVVAS